MAGGLCPAGGPLLFIRPALQGRFDGKIAPQGAEKGGELRARQREI